MNVDRRGEELPMFFANDFFCRNSEYPGRAIVRIHVHPVGAEDQHPVRRSPKNGAEVAAASFDLCFGAKQGGDVGPRRNEKAAWPLASRHKMERASPVFVSNT